MLCKWMDKLAHRVSPTIGSSSSQIEATSNYLQRFICLQRTGRKHCWLVASQLCPFPSAYLNYSRKVSEGCVRREYSSITKGTDDKKSAKHCNDGKKHCQTIWSAVNLPLHFTVNNYSICSKDSMLQTPQFRVQFSDQIDGI